ncbi:MAG TPA: DUF1801 domain-containing protein [Prolixibacteraceae bacterium]|nr:DUF1801 domain-containing protein [Prolixibacteraceae bacterium]
MTNPKPTSVDEYIAAAPKQAQEKLHELRSILKEVAPNAKEAIKWGQPVMEEKRILFAYSAYKSHLNFMPTRSTVDAFKEELVNYTTGKDTIQLPYDQPLPVELIRKMATHRAWDVRENDSRWM